MCLCMPWFSCSSWAENPFLQCSSVSTVFSDSNPTCKASVLPTLMGVGQMSFQCTCCTLPMHSNIASMLFTGVVPSGQMLPLCVRPMWTNIAQWNVMTTHRPLDYYCLCRFFRESRYCCTHCKFEISSPLFVTKVQKR